MSASIIIARLIREKRAEFSGISSSTAYQLIRDENPEIVEKFEGEIKKHNDAVENANTSFVSFSGGDVDPNDIAKRAVAYQMEQEKAGKKITVSQAVRQILDK